MCERLKNSPPVFPPIPYNPTIVHSLLTAASNNAPTWTPQCGDVAGVVWAITNEVGLPLTGPVQLLLLEVPIQCVVTGGDTATIGFWHNKNGQALIDSFNGGPTSTKLGTWLAANYGCLFGNLNGQPNTVVAAQFLAYFSVTGQKTYAQIMAGALAAYATSSTLAGGAGAAGYGFNVSATGTGAKTYNTGSNGTAIGLANNTSYTVFQLLQAANSSCPLSAAAFNALNNIFSGINQTGDIQ